MSRPCAIVDGPVVQFSEVRARVEEAWSRFNHERVAFSVRLRSDIRGGPAAFMTLVVRDPSTPKQHEEHWCEFEVLGNDSVDDVAEVVRKQLAIWELL